MTNYEIQVPLRLCHSDSPDVEAVFALVRQSHTQQNMLTPATKMFTFESSEWTAQNLQHLASHGNSYILLGEAGMQSVFVLGQRLHCTITVLMCMHVWHLSHRKTDKCCAVADRLPAERQFRVRALPAPKVLTEPQPMPCKRQSQADIHFQGIEPMSTLCFHGVHNKLCTCSNRRAFAPHLCFSL